MKTRWSRMTKQSSSNRIRVLALAGSLGGALALAGCDAFFGASEDEYLNRGVDHLNAGELSAAAIEFRNVLQENPEHAQARFFLGVTQLNQGDIDRARRDLERAAELGYSERELALPLARARAAQGAFEAVLEADAPEGMSQSELAQWHYLRGRAALYQEDRGRAEQEFRDALSADPGSADARHGQVLLAQQDGDLARIRTWVERTLAVDDEYADAWRARATLALQQDRASDAEESLDRAIASDIQPRPSDVMRRGMLRLQRGDLDGAREDATTLGRLASDAPWGPYLRGLVELQEGDRAAAQSSMEQAISRTDDFPAPRLYLAALHGDSGRYEQAEYQLDRYEAGGRRDTASSLIRVALEAARGNRERARQLLESHIQGNPEDQRALVMRRMLSNGQSDVDPSFVQTALSGLEGRSGDLDELVQQTGDDTAPRASSEEYATITKALNEGNFGQALQRTTTLLEEYPNDPELYNLKGGAHIALGEIEEAVGAFRQALQRDPSNVSAVRNLGQIFERADREDVALALYRQAYGNTPESLDIALLLIRLEARQGNDARVEVLVDEAIQGHPEDPRPRMLKARHSLLSGDPENALTVLEPLVEAQADNPAFLRLLGEARLAAGEAGAAAEALAHSRDLGADDWDSTVLYARALVESEQFDEAETVIRSAIDGDPEALHPRVLLMRLLGARGDHDAAESVYQDLLTLTDGETTVLREGAEAALRAGRPAVAVERLEQAWSREPGDELARELARALISDGERSSARTLLEDWVSSENDAEVSSAALHLLAQLQSTGDVGAANSLYERLIERNPDDVVALNNLAWNIRQQETQRAVTLAERAVSRAPEARGVRHTLAMALAEQGKTSEAIEQLERALDGAEGDVRLETLDLAELYVRSGQTNDARELLEELAGDEDFDGAQRAREILMELE